VTGEFKEDDKGYDEFVDEFGELGKIDITAGVHSDDADQVEDDDGSPVGLNLAALLSIHEWGATIDHPGGTPYIVVGDEGDKEVVFVSKDYPNPTGYTEPHTIEIPERSVLRATIAEHEQKYADLQKQAIKRVLDGDMPPEQAFGLVAQELEADIKKRFGSDDLTPNAESTIRQKSTSAGRGDSPLIDDGQLRKAIAARVADKEGL